MFTDRVPRRTGAATRWRRTVLVAAVAGAWTALPLVAQAPESPNEDEWYDPTDWFDGDDIEYNEIDWFDDTPTYNEDEWYDPTDWFDGDNIEESDIDGPQQYRWDERQNDWQRTPGRTAQQQPQQQNRFSGQTEGDVWVRIAYDFNDDGRFDAFEYIYMNDLEQARRVTQQRIAQGMQQTRSRPDFDRQRQQTGSGYYGADEPRQDWQSQQQQQQSEQRVSGEVTRLGSTTISGESHTIVEVRTDQGRTTVVDLGPRPDLYQVNLNQGDTVQVTGTMDQVQGNRVLKANRLIANGRTVTIERQDQFRQDRDKRDQYQQDQNRYQDQQQQDRSQQQQQQISGEISRVTSTDVSGETHMVVEIETEQGRTTKVDLGPRDKLTQLNLERGDTVRVYGSTKTVDGEQMFKADRLIANGRAITVEHKANLQELSGTVESTRTANFRGHPEEHTVIQLRTSDGQTHMIDLGPMSDLRSVNIERNDRISLKAEEVRINGESAYAAHEVTVNGRTHEIDREREQERIRDQRNDAGRE